MRPGSGAIRRNQVSFQPLPPLRFRKLRSLEAAIQGDSLYPQGSHLSSLLQMSFSPESMPRKSEIFLAYDVTQ